MTTTQQPIKHTFTRYQVFIIAIIAILQFTVILDFMVLSPLGAMLMEKLSIKTSQFGLLVSAYAFSAGISGLLTAGFADKFDRKKLLLFFYSGFILGTLLCAVAPSYSFLLMARIVTGIFGGVISSVSFAIITDLFKLETRGRVMGFVQMGFSASQVLGIPVGLVLANHYGWHSPFWMIGGFGALIGLLIVLYMKPITAHLLVQKDHSAFQHLTKTISKPHYYKAFLATTLLATGGFMLMPFGSAFSIHNLGLKMEQLPTLYWATGIFSSVLGPLLGKLSDKIGKYKTFVAGSILSMIMVVIYTNLGITPLWMVILINIILFTGVLSRIISSSSLMTAIPEAADRGAFMSINSSTQQFAGGIAAFIAGLIVIQKDSEAPLQHYNWLGFVLIGTSVITIVMMYFINQWVMEKNRKAKEATQVPPMMEEKMPVVVE